MSAINLGLLKVGGEDGKQRQTAERKVTFSPAGLVQESMPLAALVVVGELMRQAKCAESER